VALEPATKDTAAALEPWFDRGWREVYGRGAVPVPDVGSWLAFPPAGGTMRLIMLGGAAIGFLVFAIGKGILTIHELAVAPAHRNRVYGAEAVYALEAGEGSDCERACALVPRGNGLAIYFWLRIGYRPQFAADPAGVTFMIRDLDAAARSHPAVPSAP